MSRVVELLRSRLWPRAAALALMTIGVAACSGESSRFSDNPFGYRGNPETTASIPPAQAAPVGRVETRPLPAQNAQLAPPQPGASAPAASGGAGIAGGGRGMASYTPTPAAAGSARPAATVAPEVTGSVAPAPKPVPTGHWSWDGGTPITVGQGDTVDTVARRSCPA